MFFWVTVKTPILFSFLTRFLTSYTIPHTHTLIHSHTHTLLNLCSLLKHKRFFGTIPQFFQRWLIRKFQHPRWSAHQNLCLLLTTRTKNVLLDHILVHKPRRTLPTTTPIVLHRSRRTVQRVVQTEPIGKLLNQLFQILTNEDVFLGPIGVQQRCGHFGIPHPPLLLL